MNSAFVLYIALFRLAIIAAGVISIVLGYRLLCHGIWPGRTRQETELEVKVGETHFTLKNTAPGTCFAMFGVVIISVMFAQGAPKLTLETLQEGGLVRRMMVRSDDMGVPRTLTQPGNVTSTVDTLTQQGITNEQKGYTDLAIAAYQKAVTLATPPMNHLAWIYQKSGRINEALPLSRLAVHFQPEKAEFLDTLAVILCKTGELSEALKIIEKASKMMPDKFADRFNGMKMGVCQ